MSSIIDDFIARRTCLRKVTSIRCIRTKASTVDGFAISNLLALPSGRESQKTMATDSTVGAPKRKLKPARKQVEVDEIDRSEKVQPGKEYSESSPSSCPTMVSDADGCQMSGTTNGQVETKRML